MRVDQIKDWLDGLEFSEQIRWVQEDMPDKPDLVGLVAPGGGRLGRHEGAVDSRSFLIQIRGAANKYGQPERLLEEIRVVIEQAVNQPEGFLWCVQFGPTVVVPGTLRSSRRPEAVATFSYEETR